MIALAASVPLVAVNLVASSIWVGGLFAIALVARTATGTLAPSQRVEFFAVLGRSYGILGTGALLVALASGAVLLRDHPWDRLMVAAVIVAWSLVAVSAVGMAQARRMTRLRRRSGLESLAIEAQIRRGAIAATVLRGTIAALTLVLVVLAAALSR